MAPFRDAETEDAHARGVQIDLSRVGRYLRDLQRAFPKINANLAAP